MSLTRMEISHAGSNQSLKTLSSTIASDSSTTSSGRHQSIETRVCLVGNIPGNEGLKKKLKDLNIPFLLSDTGMEYANDDDPYYETIFILQDFEGHVFESLRKTDNRLLGPPVINAVASTNEPLPYTSRPLYCTCMQGLNLCFTNFKTKEHLAHLVTLCHYMGACIRKDMSSKIDFLVTNSLHGPKYRTAVSLGTPVMKEEWIHRCWSAKHREALYKATDDEFLAPCKSRPFEGCVLSFLGFSEGEKSHMEEQAKQQGGGVAEVSDPACSHVVVDENTVKSLPFVPQGKLYVVVQEWFWGSIQIEAKAAESMYVFNRMESKMMTRSSTTSSLLGTPKWRGSSTALGPRCSRHSSGKSPFSRKRSRLREETLAKLAQDIDGEAGRNIPPRKRPSTDSSACLPDSMLDMSGNTTATSVGLQQTPESAFRGINPMMLRNGKTLVDSFSSLPRVDRTNHMQNTECPTTPDNLNVPIRQTHSQGSFKLKQWDLNTESLSKITPGSEDNSLRLSRKRKSSEHRNRSKRDKKREDEAISASPDFKTPREVPPGSNNSSRKQKEQRRRRFSISAHSREPSAPKKGVLRRLSLLPTGRRGISLLEEEVEEISGGPTEEEDLSFNELKIEEESPKAVPLSARGHVAMELLQTEKNYVGILQTILNLFKKPLDDPNQAGGPILAMEDVKAIFSSLPEIEAVHTKMSADLQLVIQSWNDKSCIGPLILNYVEEFGKCYPPFVNFFEVSADTISHCESRSSRFHAFLKINQSKPECGRQTLAELMINPVQRVPRIILLLQDIKKHTERENPTHPDVKGIQQAIDALKEVMTHINEDKRKTESQRQIFDIVYEVDGCPPTIVSSHRQFIARAELVTADENLCNKGDHVCVFIFSDCIEIAKRRRGIKSNHSFKSPSVNSRPPSSAVKCLKHIKLMSLSHIKKVVNINDSDDCQNAVSLYCRTPTDTQDWLYTFKVISCSACASKNEETGKENSAPNRENDDVATVGKSQFLQILARHRASTVCKTIDNSFVCSVNPDELDVNTADLGSTFGRAVRAAKKSSRKLTRAFSFSRTPRRVVQRAVTNMLSPSQQKPPTGLQRADSTTSRDLTDDDATQATGLTPSMSVTSLCTPQRDRKGNRVQGSASFQSEDEEDPVRARYATLRPSCSTMTLARQPTAKDKSDFPAMPTPPARRKKSSAIKAATIAFHRSTSFRRRPKLESMV